MFAYVGLNHRHIALLKYLFTKRDTDRDHVSESFTISLIHKRSDHPSERNRFDDFKGSIFRVRANAREIPSNSVCNSV